MDMLIQAFGEHLAASIKTINVHIFATSNSTSKYMSYKNTPAHKVHKDIYYSVVPKREVHLVVCQMGTKFCYPYITDMEYYTDLKTEIILNAC